VELVAFGVGFMIPWATARAARDRVVVRRGREAKGEEAAIEAGDAQSERSGAGTGAEEAHTEPAPEAGSQKEDRS